MKRDRRTGEPIVVDLSHSPDVYKTRYCFPSASCGFTRGQPGLRCVKSCPGRPSRYRRAALAPFGRYLVRISELPWA